MSLRSLLEHMQSSSVPLVPATLSKERTAKDQENQVNSLGSPGSLIKNEMSKRGQLHDLHQFVEKCCEGLCVKAQLVIDHLLSVNDEQDIINRMIPAESLRLHIEVWISTGKPHYSGKNLD